MTYDGSLVFLSVADLMRSSDFYRSLGLDLMIDQGECHILGDAGQMMLGLCGGRIPAPDGVIFTLVSERVEELCGELSASGVVFEQEPARNDRFGITHAFLRDPDGYLVEIQRFESSDGIVR